MTHQLTTETSETTLLNIATQRIKVTGKHNVTNICLHLSLLLADNYAMQKIDVSIHCKMLLTVAIVIQQLSDNFLFPYC